MTAGQHHVLLVGIDAYDGGGSLNGCVNDIDAVQRLLLQRVGIEPARITRLASPRTDTEHETAVPEKPATLANIRAALASLDSNTVKADDRVLVYYSGHGTQCLVTDGNGRRFAREALLPKDKLVAGTRQFLFDWEINQAIARIAARAPRTTVILDCCSSGGITRGPQDASDGVRFFATDEPVSVENVDLAPGKRGVVASLGSVSNCQVVAACRDDQRARESVSAEGTPQGELTRALIAQLATIPDADLAKLHWGRVWRSIDLAVRSANPNQSPWLFGSFGRRIFGFDVDEDGDPGYAMVQVPEGFAFDTGTLQGVTEGAVIGVYGALPAAFPPLGSDADRAVRVGEVTITRADPAQCTGTAVAPFVVPAAPRGRLVAAGRNARLRVRVTPSHPAIEAAIKLSPLLELVSRGEEVGLVRRADQAWAVTDDIHGTGDSPAEPVLAVIPGDRIDVVRPVLEHYLAYITPVRMARACTDLPGMLSISMLDCNGETNVDPASAQTGALPAIRELKAGARVCIAVDNAALMTLSVALFDCAPSGRVKLLAERRLPAALQQPDGSKVPSRHVVWADDVLGKSFKVSVPAGQRIGIERLVAIGTTSTTASLQALQRATTFASLISPVQMRGERGTRDLDDDATARGPTVDQWTSATSAVRVEVV